jgi:hypothetical protein
MCEGLLWLGVGAVMLWMSYRLARSLFSPHRKTFSKSPFAPTCRASLLSRDDGAPVYRSPLGLVDNPDDEWIEWAIMEDILDGPDEGLFR